jgi:hypothetical protein
MNKEETLEKIRLAIMPKNKDNSRNSMGVSESYYNAYYMVGKFMELDKLELLSDEELNRLISLAEFAGDSFY